MENKVVDMTGIESPKFQYRVRTVGENGKESVVEKRLDCAWVLLQVRQSIPTAFKKTGNLLPDGSPEVGMHVMLRCFEDGEDLPAHLPQLTHMITAFKTALQLPSDVGVEVTMQLVRAFVQQASERGAAKKSTPDLPSSPEHTPEASD